MRNLKKVLALVVAFSMMLSVVAFAGYKDVPADAEYAGALDLLSSLDIIKGDDLGNFNPDATITRAEMAAIVCRAKGLESAANGAKGATVFTDVAADHWASGYINLASQNNIINGYGDGKFGPEDTVTYEQVIKMLVCALGFEPMAAANGGWATGYLVVANRYKVTEGAAADATRKNVATLVYNALSTPMMDQTSFGADAEYQILDGKGGRDYKTLLTDMDIYVATGIVDDYDVESVYLTLTESSEDGEFVYDEDEDNSVDFEKGDLEVAPYMYQSVDVYVQKTTRKDYEVVAIVGSVMGETLAILSDDIVEDETIEDGEFEYYIDPANSSKTKKIKVAIDDDYEANIIYNRGAAEKKFEDLVAEDDIEIILIENTGDRTFDRIIATKYTSALVNYVDVDNDEMEIGDALVEFDFEDEDLEIVLVDEKGNTLTLADFAEDDVVAVVADDEYMEDYEKYIKVIKLSDAAITGVIDEVYTQNKVKYIVVDGNEYALDKDNKDVYDLNVGDEGTFFIGMTGKVVEFDGSVVGKNYAYILEAAKSESSFSADKWQVKLLTKEDGIVTYDVTDEMNEEFDKYFKDETDAFTLEDDAYLFDANKANLANKARLISYKTNAKGQIRAFDAAEGTAKAIDKSDDKYNDRTQIIKRAVLEDDIVIFNVSGTEAEDAYVTDITYLVDESGYTGFVYEDDGEYGVMVVTEGDSIFSDEAGFAVATKVSSGKNAEDDEITKVSYVQNGVAGEITIDDEADNKGDVDRTALTVGSVFLFNADASGVATSFVVIATVEDGALKVSAKGLEVAADGDAIEDIEDNDVVIFEAYIANDQKDSGTKGERITLVESVSDDVEDGEIFTITRDANKYTFNNSGRNVVIETSSFMKHDDMRYAKAGKYYSKVLVRVVEGEVIDIYGFYVNPDAK